MERQMSNPDITTGLDVVIDYQAGRISMEEAVFRFCSETGMDENFAQKFFAGLSRDNVVPFKAPYVKSKPTHRWHLQIIGTGLLRSRQI